MSNLLDGPEYANPEKIAKFLALKTNKTDLIEVSSDE